MKVFTTLLLLLLVPVSVSWGGDNAFFFGGRYDDGFLLSYGTAIDIGPNLWAFEYANWGDPYGEISSEVGYLVKVVDGFSVGPLLGPNVDVYAGDDFDPVTYVVGASGLLATYEFGLSSDAFTNVGTWVYCKYKYNLEKNNAYQDGWAIGGGIYVWW